MAYYAIIQNRIVESVITGVNETVTQEGIGGSTESWEAYYESLPWYQGKTIRRCSYSGSIRKNYPGPGFTFDPIRDAFIPPKPFDSWVLNETTCNWDPPVSYPDGPGKYQWNETSQTWDSITQ
jgi:hypothetical protein